MCGIVGYAAPGRPRSDGGALVGMLRELRHRGPDDEGYALIEPRSGRHRAERGFLSREPSGAALDGFAHEVGLGHCRFSIVDLSEAGHQPFWSEDGSAVLAFNGEIYNHLELREQLEKRGHRFRSRCDTEVLLNAFLEWDVEAFERLHGFWALALYDLRRRRLVLSRDRMGKAPLYWGVRDGVCFFASELPALVAGLGGGVEVRPQAVADFVHRGWRDLEGETFYQGIRCLPPASFAVLTDAPEPRPERYWRLPSERWNERSLPLPEAQARLREALEEAVRLRERADAPVAMELSGGLDSTSLVALRASRAEARPIPVYTVKFDDPSADEEPLARLVAERYPETVDYRVIRPPPLEFWDQANAFVRLVGEPFHAPNLLTNHAMKQRIRADGHRVVLVGSGGDELLGGYPEEVRQPYLRQLLAQGRWPRLARELAAGGPAEWRVLARQRLRGTPEPGPHPATRGLLASDEAPARCPAAHFDARMRENWERWKLPYWLRSGNNVVYGVPIEARAPFLDQQLAELAFRLPASYLHRDGWTKALLRLAVADILPAEIVWRRRKMGFPFPWRSWLRDSKPVLLRNVAGCELPGLRVEALPAVYDELVEADPKWLWRFASVALWHRRCNLGQPIEP